jgi:hypothetical protein
MELKIVFFGWVGLETNAEVNGLFILLVFGVWD